MEAELATVALGELCEFHGGAAFSPEYQGRSHGHLPFIKVSDMNSAANAIVIREANHWVDEPDAHAMGAKAVPPGAVVFAKIGEALRANRLRLTVRPTLIDNNMMAAIPNPTIVDPRYFYYAMSQIDFNVVAQGTALPYLTIKSLRSVPITIVSDMDEQRRIAHILRTLDDKIELNRRMNETLEEMARALFMSWFVDFDPVRAKAEGRDPGLPKHLADLFPDRLVDSELGEIPEGWTVRRVEDLAEKVAMGPFGSSIKVETFAAEGVPVISGQHLRGLTLEDSSFNFITHEHASRLASANVRRGDVVFTHAGSIGQAAYIPRTSRYERYVISQRQFYMRCDEAEVTPEFVAMYFNSPTGRHRLLANTSSSGVPSIARPVSYLRTIPLTVPPIEVIRVFSSVSGSLLNAVASSKGLNRTLAQLKDRLLRCLLSASGASCD